MTDENQSAPATGNALPVLDMPEIVFECGHFQAHRCRSCQMLDRRYQATLQHKHDALEKLFPKTLVSPFVPCQSISGSRIRAKLAVTGTINQPQIGFFDDHQSLVAVNDCPLHHALINDWTQRLPSMIREARLMPYDLHTDRGELKFVILTCSPSHEQLMMQFVLRSQEAVDRIRSLWRRMTAAEKQTVPVLSVNLQPARSSTITGTEEIAISDQARLSIRFNGTELQFGPQSFIQTNHEIAEKLYAAAGRLLGEQDAKNVLDLYCGAGAFSLTAGSDMNSVVGIDRSEDAIACASEVARQQNRNNALFRCRGLDQLTADELAAHNFDTVICNPPRRGLDSASVNLIQTLRPRLLVYSSCNPVTLHRDVQLLAPGYAVSQLQPFDMFPFTQHFEALALLLRQE